MRTRTYDKWLPTGGSKTIGNCKQAFLKVVAYGVDGLREVPFIVI